MSSFPPQMGNGMSLLGLRLVIMLVKSMAGLEDVAVTTARSRSVVVWFGRRPRPRPRVVVDREGVVSDQDRTERS